MTTVSPVKDEVERLRETIVELWHDSKSDNGPLHECLGMTWEEYGEWVNGTKAAALEVVDEMFSNPGRINKNTVRDKVRAALSSPEPVGEGE